MSRFNDRAERILVKSVSLAEDLGHTYIGSEHILLAMLASDDTIAGKLLASRGITYTAVNKVIVQYTGVSPQSTLYSEDFTPRVRKLLEAAYSNSRKYAGGTVDTEHILLAMLEEKDAVAYKILKNQRCDITGLKDEIIQDLRAKQGTKADDGLKSLKIYGKDMIRHASEGKFDPVIGRDLETDRLIRILTRKSKNNPCLIGEAGVGKTAIVEGLAMRIANGDVPCYLKDRLIWSLDLTNMVAGAKYRGDFEDRIKNVLNEVVKHGKIILFIDEIHTIVGAGAAEGAIDASNILKPQLSRGEIQIIGSTTIKEYHKYIERDAALERRFQPIMVEEPSVEATFKMLHGLKERYENHHKVSICEDAISETISLCKRYISDRFFPDKAIDILDETCAYVVAKSQCELNNYDNNSRQMEKRAAESNHADDLIYDIDISNRSERAYVPEERLTVTATDVRQVVAEICRLPPDRLNGTTEYRDLQATLDAEFVGNEQEMHRLITMLKRREYTSKNDSKPFASIMMSGADQEQLEAFLETVAGYCFGKESSLYRLDMREYSERNAVTRLIGSPPGYEGHEEGGALTERVRRFPYSLVCFERIDAACAEVKSIISQILTKGKISDANSRTVSFQNAIIIITDDTRDSKFIGFSTSIDQNEPITLKHNEDFCVDIKITLSASGDKIKAIASKKLSEFVRTVAMSGIRLQFSDAVLPHFIELIKNSHSSFNLLNAKFKEHIENPVIDYICLSKSTDLMVDVADNQVIIRETADIK